MEARIPEHLDESPNHLAALAAHVPVDDVAKAGNQLEVIARSIHTIGSRLAGHLPNKVLALQAQAHDLTTALATLRDSLRRTAAQVQSPVADHVETKIATWLRQTGISPGRQHLTVVINKNKPCGRPYGCQVDPERSVAVMILSVAVHGQYRQVTSPHDLDLLIEELTTDLAPGNPWTNMDCGETAELYLADTALTAETFDEPQFDWQAHSVLTVSVNSSTGLGALRWNMKLASTNPDPPHDPRVVFDPEVPYWFHPRHVLPTPRIMAAVREFCDEQGHRPKCVGWADFHRAAGSYLDSNQYRSLFPKAA